MIFHFNFHWNFFFNYENLLKKEDNFKCFTFMLFELWYEHWNIKLIEFKWISFSFQRFSISICPPMRTSLRTLQYIWQFLSSTQQKFYPFLSTDTLSKWIEWNILHVRSSSPSFSLSKISKWIFKLTKHRNTQKQWRVCDHSFSQRTHSDQIINEKSNSLWLQLVIVRVHIWFIPIKCLLFF